MKYSALIATLSIALPISAAAEVYRCKDDRGATVLQQMPCISSAPSVGAEVRAREAAHQRNRDLASEAARRQELEKLEKERVQRIDAEAADPMFNHVAVKKDCGTTDIPEAPTTGMTERRMFSCTWLGRANAFTLVNTTEVVGSVTRQYSGTFGAVKYVYTRNGVVTGIQR